MNMEKIQCPKCKQETSINIAKAVDEHGEEFRCEKCGYIFRYVKH